ncbi:hypothetical protein [Kocuria atrinae]|uniref:DUF3592 domain-containing protein n=1 Tax=Kocuria atrinae TaxID=592377 RepID=A0ABN2Y4T7_9MICC
MRTLISIGYIAGAILQALALVWVYFQLRRTLQRNEERDAARCQAERTYEARLGQAKKDYEVTYKGTPKMYEWWASGERQEVEDAYSEELKNADALVSWHEATPTAGDVRMTTAQLDGYWTQGALLVLGILISCSASVASVYLPAS